ncbi:MAG: asparagine synthase (glutamine-hydrolyzing) [Alphaproteobacteria bacterium]|nr:asparagine synthase (glutamine-hydrolyzing) [Alphaproteobacteria bacterium]
MCGLTGFVGVGDEDSLRAMTAALTHRGPDGEGYYRDHHAPVFLGHRRLIVLDPDGGTQPMWDAQGTVAVVFNGLIYNHRALRAELEQLGHHFTSDHADTEVLVHGWKAWGRDLFMRLDGMFALAIYDRNKSTVTLARDRFGEKPLYYAARSEAFVFGSELTALLHHPSLKNATPSKIALQKFFAHGFFPAPHTPYDGISKLLPGQCLTIDAKTLATQTRTYWRFSLGGTEQPAGSEDDWAAELNALVGDAVSSRLEADVPLGLFLSGGVDSSTVLSCAADVRTPASLSTFSIGFRETSFDESPWAEEMALRVGSTHHVEICDLDAAQSGLPGLLSHLDEPQGDPSILPTNLLCRFARKHVTVALSGDGGDELFAGYDPFRVLKRAALYNQVVPKPMHDAIRYMAGWLPRSDANMSFDFILNRGLRGLKHPPSQWNPRWLGALGPDDISDLFNTTITAEELYSEAIEAWDACASPHLVDKTLDFYTRFYLPDGILTKTDRASMAVGLEVRSPFLANGVAEFAQRLPWHVKLKGRTTKWLLKRALKDRLPSDILNRKKKGFGIPLSRWLRSMDPPKSNVPHTGSAWLKDRWLDHQSGRRDDRAALWCWMALSHGLKASP